MLQESDDALLSLEDREGAVDDAMEGVLLGGNDERGTGGSANRVVAVIIVSVATVGVGVG